MCSHPFLSKALPVCLVGFIPPGGISYQQIFISSAFFQMSRGRLKLSRMLRLISLLTFIRMQTVSTLWILNVSLSLYQVSQSTSLSCSHYTVGCSLQSHIPVPSCGICLVPSFQVLIALVGTFPLTQVISSFCYFKKLKYNYVFLPSIPSLHPSVSSLIYIIPLVPLNFMASFLLLLYLFI